MGASTHQTPIAISESPSAGRRLGPEHDVTDADLVRFLDAQSGFYDQVTDELTKGRKRTHWMWFIFPQLAGLGHSPMAQRYAIRDSNQAERYLADPVVGRRLRHDVRLMTSHKGKSALEILGTPDDLKFRSCLTLFAAAASDDSDRVLFKQALEQFYDGEPDPRTMELLRSTSPRNTSS
jgi:uncharacterized protein (DUF1810 family)